MEEKEERAVLVEAVVMGEMVRIYFTHLPLPIFLILFVRLFVT